ncbi:MAG: 2-C-methyl-D-erythritol 2,4-cyclodiphosphate synthase [Flavobacteriales bacterium]|nr:2-C-methyl-D-erythritol 2,4-cyclodiphosphate synthase [Flavobacteriales bacterium]MBK6943590.1 2-C-methyl-D-erythritol 2,4-cyclodiphosphate synthase [Flavobacteriales bacterium]MBK7240535.1 2-C-methyl-D-erythritol 2,4-cyclodiphosphate synthase [Flavobacteriales bacterium]MBK9535882.1 2-C-methyl-D-erythritol 2,4-cyclodiphosphate synthase [Flavobacteriales bacterium]MBP9138605.1 2-C-methyl-D-erythritol 2,4-cyclodiphosphate synthase [Flavobacteriales bacterium]
MIRVGLGYDVHRFAEGRELWLGGILIPHSVGLLGHSDADVLLHALCDALLGAAGMGDIGTQFPDTAAEWKGADSKELLKLVMIKLTEAGWSVGNVDSTLVMERPKIMPHVPAMRAVIAAILGVGEDAVGIKATTNEKLGFVGREEGACAHAVALIERK